MVDVISALGAGAFGFSEANADERRIEEQTGNTLEPAILAPGAKFFIGKPFAALPSDATFLYSGPESQNKRGGIYFAAANPVPEPDAWRLGLTAFVLMSFVARRSVRVAAQRG